MRQKLQSLGFKFEDTDLDPLIRLFAGAQQQRVDTHHTETGKLTRTTAIVALSQIAPQIAEGLKSAGLDWQAFRKSIGLLRSVLAELPELRMDDLATTIDRRSEPGK